MGKNKEYRVGTKVKYWNATHTKQGIGVIERIGAGPDLIYIEGEFGSSLRYKYEVEIETED